MDDNRVFLKENKQFSKSETTISDIKNKSIYDMSINNNIYVEYNEKSLNKIQNSTDVSNSSKQNKYGSGKPYRKIIRGDFKIDTDK